MDQEQQAKQGNPKRENLGLLQIDALLMVFLLIGWSLIFVAATVGLSRSDQLWLPINPVVDASAANYGVDTNSSKIPQVKPEIIDAVKEDERVRDLLKSPPTLLTQVTITPTATLTETTVDLLTVSVGGPYRGLEGSPLTFVANNFDSALSFLPGSVSYRWDLDQDGLYDDAEGETVEYTFFDEGDYAISVRAEDLLGREATDIGFAYIENADPVVDVGENLYVSESKSLGFAAVADDPGNDILTFEWDFGDGSPFAADTLNPQHIYPDDGEYVATLYVRDNDGGQAQDSLTVFVGNLSPEVKAGPDQTVDEGSEITFMGTAEDPAGDFDTLFYAWDLDFDGRFEPDIEGKQVTTIYPDGPERVAVALQVKDEDGGEGIDTLDVTVRNVPPTITRLTHNGPGAEGSSINLTVEATDPGEDTLTYAFDWNGNGSFDSETNSGEVSHIYTNQGAFTVTVRVRDEDGGEDFASTTITALNAPPIAIASCSDTPLVEGTLFSCSAQDSFDPGVNDDLTYLWDFGDGTTVGTEDASHTYADNGVYTTTLTVTDDSGASGVETLFATFLNADPTIDLLELEADSIPEFRPGSGDNVTLDQLIRVFEASDPGPEDNENLIYQWEVVYNGTSTILLGKNPVFTLENIDGPSEIRLTARVRDNDYPASTTNGGQIGEAARLLVVNVDNVPPQDIKFSGPRYVSLSGGARGYVGLTNETIQLSAAANDVSGDENDLTYDWDLDNDGTFEIQDTPTTQFSQSATGVYDIRVRVSDGDDEATRSTQVYVIQPANVGNLPDTLESIPVNFDAGNSGDPGQALLTYVWNFGDGSPTGSGRTVTHAYADNNDVPYTVKLCLFLASQASKTCDIASDNSLSSDTTSITITNAAPQVTITADSPSSGVEGETLTFTSVVTDTSADTLTFFWDFGDGSSVITGTDRAIESHAYPDEGTYTLALTVTDEDNGSTVVTQTINITNMKPIVKATDGLKATEGQTITVTGVATDVIGDLLTYTWDLDNNGTFETTPTQAITDSTNGAFKTVKLPAQASWNTGGIKPITVRVIDGDGGVTTDTTTVDVNFIPLAKAGGPYGGNEGQMITVTGIATDTDSDDTLSYTWNMGDGSNPVAGPEVSYAYADNGTYMAVLTVDDGQGGVVSDMAQVSVSNLPPTITTLDGDTTGDEGQLLSFTATASDTVADILTYQWDFDSDGTVDQSGIDLTVVTHLYPDEGNYTLTLTVTDDDGASVSSTLAISISNAPPTARLNTPYNGNEGTTSIAFDASASSDPGSNDTLSYVWDFGDGSPTASGVTTNHTYPVDGVYTVTLTVSDDFTPPATDVQQASVTINNLPPTARITGGPFSVDETSPTVNFDASTSSDPGADDQSLSYLWDFGDGNTSTQVNPSHTYPDNNGTYTVRLTVTDSDSATNATTVPVTVNNLPPNAVISANPQNTDENNLTIDFDASGSTDPSRTGSITEYRWDFDDGNTATTASPTTSHTYGDSGTYNASVVVVDDDGATSNPDTIRVTVNNLPPNASFTANPQNTDEANLTINFDASASSDPGNDTLTYSWDFGDSSPTVSGPQEQVSHSYSDNGAYNVTLTVSDNDGASNSTSLTVDIQNLPPSGVSISGPSAISVGSTVTYSGSGSDISADPLAFEWFVDGNSQATGTNFDFSPAVSGTYTIELRVTDDEGSSASASLNVTANSLIPLSWIGLPFLWQRLRRRRKIK